MEALLGAMRMMESGRTELKVVVEVEGCVGRKFQKELQEDGEERQRVEARSSKMVSALYYERDRLPRVRECGARAGSSARPTVHRKA